MGIVIFNGVSSQDLHALVQEPPEYVFPEKDQTSTHVPGRNGDIVVDDGTWQNVNRKYNIAIDARKFSYAEVASKLVQWLHSTSGYARLEDTYEPDYFRMAMYKESGSISNIYSKAGQLDVVFDCKPQRYLKSGEKTDDINTNTVYYNPTGFSSNPKIVVHGSGSGVISIGQYTININNILDAMVIDSEIQDTYKGNINCNSRVSILNYPKLVPGNNNISISGGISHIEITPRWWTL